MNSKGETCGHGDRFTPRADETERFGARVMGCERPGWEGYAFPESTCEAHFVAVVKDLVE